MNQTELENENLPTLLKAADRLARVLWNGARAGRSKKQLLATMTEQLRSLRARCPSCQAVWRVVLLGPADAPPYLRGGAAEQLSELAPAPGGALPEGLAEVPVVRGRHRDPKHGGRPRRGRGWSARDNRGGRCGLPDCLSVELSLARGKNRGQKNGRDEREVRREGKQAVGR